MVLLVPRFRLRQIGEQSGEMAVRSDPPVGGKMCEYQLDAKTAASTETRPYLPQRRHVTFCDARWQIDSRLDQPAQQIEQNKSNTAQTCESLLLWGRNSVLENKSSLTVCNSDTLFNCRWYTCASDRQTRCGPSCRVWRMVNWRAVFVLRKCQSLPPHKKCLRLFPGYFWS